MKASFLMMTMRDVRKMLGIGTSRAYELTRWPGFPVVRIGKKRTGIRVPREALLLWLTAQQSEPWPWSRKWLETERDYGRTTTT